MEAWKNGLKSASFRALIRLVMETKREMKILCRRNLPPYWERFNRLQRRVNLLLHGKICPKGVFRFATHEEFEQWKLNLALSRRASPTK